MAKKVQFVFDDRSEVDRETLIRQGFQELTIGDLTVFVPNYATLCNCLQNRCLSKDKHWPSCPSYQNDPPEPGNNMTEDG